MAEPLQCFIIGLLPIPATYSINVCACMCGRCTHARERLMNAHIWSTVKNMLTLTILLSFIPSPMLIFSLCIQSIRSCLYFTLLHPVSVWIHAVLYHTHTKHTHGARHRFDSAERVTSYFPLYYTFQRKVQSLLLRRRRPRVDFTSKPVEAAFSRLAPRGLRGILECRGMYLN